MVKPIYFIISSILYFPWTNFSEKILADKSFFCRRHASVIVFAEHSEGLLVAALQVNILIIIWNTFLIIYPFNLIPFRHGRAKFLKKWMENCQKKLKRD